MEEITTRRHHLQRLWAVSESEEYLSPYNVEATTQRRRQQLKNELGQDVTQDVRTRLD